MAQRQGGGEKRFSLGPFDPDYLARFDCAVIRREGAVVAFANLWSLPNGEELSCDPMRHLPDAPYGTMDVMFVRPFQWPARKATRASTSAWRRSPG